MTWIEYDYLCNENKGITFHKKVEYNEANLAIAQQEAIDGNYSITEDDEVVGVQPLAIGLGGTNAKTAEEACKNIGGLNTYTHGSNGLTGMGANGKFKATTTGTISSIKVNETTCSVKCGEDTSMDLVAGCWYTFIRDGNVVNFNAGGAGGGGLELKIVGGTTRPRKPSQNMIWINTPNEITRYALQSVEPSNPIEGMVLITISDSGSIKVVSPVGGDWITVYPISAKQYIGGAWVDKSAKSYQYGEWVDWWLGELYVAGDEYAGTTGGWVFRADYADQTPIGSKGLSSITVGSSSTYAAAYNNATHNNYISLELFTEVKVHIVSAKSGGSSTCVAKMRIMDESGTEKSNVLFFEGQSKSITDQWYSIDVSGLPPGLYKVEIHARHTSSSKQYCYVEFDEVRCV